ncbi:MAG: Fur family transcriptional regulator [Actinomycetota bacterium]|nr:Fur family transcriptional regulator [Actinomycetota bacterium]
MEPTREDLVDLVRAAGLRVTASRVAVLRALSARPHADTDTVIRQVRAELGSVSPQAVYNVLAAFAQAGLVRRIEPAGSVALYELRVKDNHHHVVCRRCGAIQDVDCAVGRRPCLTPSDAHGYLLDEAEVTYWGICPACQSDAIAGQGAARTGRSGPPAPKRPTTRQRTETARQEEDRRVRQQ